MSPPRGRPKEGSLPLGGTARSAKGAHLSVWQRLDAEFDAWRSDGRRAELWCRDDDACRDSPAIDRLLEISGEAEVPVALAVIPALTEPSLVDRVAQARFATVVQHGYAHRNHAPPGARNWELGSHRPVAQSVAELATGRAGLERNFGPRFRPVLVPPWNRIDPQVTERLSGAGFIGLSTFGPRAALRPVPDLVQCNAHVDLIAWRRDRAFIGVEAAIDRLVVHLKSRREGTVDATEPTGILTHHLDLDAAAWQFLADLFAHTRDHGAVTWLDVDAVFEK
jgi:hypothetical protein